MNLLIDPYYRRHRSQGGTSLWADMESWRWFQVLRALYPRVGMNDKVGKGFRSAASLLSLTKHGTSRCCRFLRSVLLLQLFWLVRRYDRITHLISFFEEKKSKKNKERKRKITLMIDNEWKYSKFYYYLNAV